MKRYAAILRVEIDAEDKNAVRAEALAVLKKGTDARASVQMEHLGWETEFGLMPKVS